MLKQLLLQKNLVIDNAYLDAYIQLIEGNSNTYKQAFITQQHHIIPRYYYNHHNIPVNNDASNLVNLKFCDHLLAHYYLMRCSSSTIFELANANAIIKNTNNIHSVDTEEWLLQNHELLQQINERRASLISQHHADVRGSKNPKSKKVFVYRAADATLVKTIGSKVEAQDYFRDILNLRGKINKVGGCLYGDLFITDKPDISREHIKHFVNLYEDKVQHLNEIHRDLYKITCKHCGKEYTKMLARTEYEKRLLHGGCCAECSRSGATFRGTTHTALHTSRIAESAQGRKWVNNGLVARQLHEPELSQFLAKGWVLGQLKKIPKEI